VCALSAHAARFAGAIQASGDVTTAAHALVDCGAQDATRAVEIEVFTAPFAAIVRQEAMS
jgi:hypothetical protein